MLSLNHDFFGIAAGIVSVIAFIPYVRSILKGHTKPSGASWWTWTIITTITVFSSWYAGATWEVLILPIWLCFSQFTVAVLSLKRGTNDWDFTNKSFVFAACLGLIIWFLTGQPLIALTISIVIDLLASIPNLRHVFANPEQENKAGWTLGWFSAVLEIFAISQLTLAESSWAIYFLFNMSLTLILVWRPAVKKLLVRNA